MIRRHPVHVAEECATVRLTAMELALVRRAARCAGLTVGGLLRSLALPHARTLDARRLPRWVPEDHVYVTPPRRVRNRRVAPPCPSELDLDDALRPVDPTPATQP